MGAQLVALFEQAKQHGGVKAQLKMAMITKLSITKAEAASDSAELIGVAQKALSDIKSS